MFICQVNVKYCSVLHKITERRWGADYVLMPRIVELSSSNVLQSFWWNKREIHRLQTVVKQLLFYLAARMQIASGVLGATRMKTFPFVGKLIYSFSSANELNEI